MLIDSAGNALNNASNIVPIIKPVALTGILVNGLLKNNNSDGNKTIHNVVNNVNNINRSKISSSISSSSNITPTESNANLTPSANPNLTKPENNNSNSNRWMNPNPILSNLQSNTTTTTTTTTTSSSSSSDTNNNVMVGSSSSLIRQIGRLKLNNSTLPQPNRGVSVGNKVEQEQLLIEDLKSSSGKMYVCNVCMYVCISMCTNI